MQEPIPDLCLRRESHERLKHVERVQHVNLSQARIRWRIGTAHFDGGDAHACDGQAERVGHLWQAEARRDDFSDRRGQLHDRLDER
jgi:hypothetical protein